MARRSRSRPLVLGVCALLSLGILAIDLAVPLGVAAGVLYVLVVLLTLWSPRRSDVHLAAIASSAFILVGYALSRSGGIEWMVVANRALSLFAVWTTAGVCLGRRSVERSLIEADRALEERLREAESARAESAEAEGCYRRERDFAENLIQTAPVIVLLLDCEGRIMRYNRYLAELTGWPLEETRGKSWFETFLPARDRERTRSVFGDVLAEDATQGIVNPILTRDGEERQIEWHNSVLRNAEGKVCGVLAAGRDISDRRILEEELRQSQKMEAIGRLAGGIAHDFNNLLMGVIGCCRMAAEKGSAEQMRPFVEEILGSAERGASLTRQLMTFSRRRVATPRPMRLTEVIDSTRRMIQQLLGEDIELSIEQNADPHIEADPGHIEQVLMNLVVNARDAMAGGGKLTIRTGKVACSHDGRGGDLDARSGPHAALEVSDTGCGMDAETRDRAFEPFFTTKPEGEGTGLGLATVYGIVQQIRGHVHLDSTPGRGTTFRIHFPRVAAPVPEAHVPAPAAPAVPSGAGETVLVVEDERLVRASLRTILKRLGYRTLDAGDPAAALEICREHRGEIDVLLTDMVMPGMGGGELAREVRSLEPGVQTVYMSAYPEAVLVEQGRIEPGQTTLEKPFEEEELAVCVRTVLDRRTKSPAVS